MITSSHVSVGDRRAVSLYHLTFGLAIGASVGDAATTWWLQQQGATEMTPALIAVKSAAGLFGMLAVIVVVKALALTLVEALWRAARSLGTRSAEWETAGISTLVCVAALVPVLHNLASWLQPV